MGLGLGLYFGLWLGFGLQLGLWLVWCYGRGKFRVRIRDRVVNMFGVMGRVNTTQNLNINP